MINDSLANVGISLANIGSAFAERRRQEGQGSVAPFKSFEDRFGLEIRRLRAEGQEQLADALETLRTNIGVMDNG